MALFLSDTPDKTGKGFAKQEGEEA